MTQVEVARRAGVSQAMVSLVLNGSDSVRVTPETRRRVEDALRETGYAVDVLGRRLRGKANRLLGVFTYESVFPSGSADFYVPFLGGIEEAAERAGYDLLLFTSPGRTDGRRQVYEAGGNRLGIADGSILLGRHTDREELARLLDERLPFVFIGRRESPAGEVSWVSADYAAATEDLYDFAWSSGHRRIGLVGLAEDNEATVDRRLGYERAARKHRRRPEVIDGGDPAEVWSRIRELALTAVLVETVAMAEVLATLVRADGMDVPDDLSVGVLGDRDPSQAVAAPQAGRELPWTMFHIPRRRMGAEAVRLLVDELEGREDDERPRQILLPCERDEGATIRAVRS